MTCPQCGGTADRFHDRVVCDCGFRAQTAVAKCLGILAKKGVDTSAVRDRLSKLDDAVREIAREEP